MKKNYCHISVLLDKSGSMSSIKNDVIGGFNQFMDEQKKAPGELSVSLLAFSSAGEGGMIYNFTKSDDVKDLTEHNYITIGSTALNDSFAELVQKTGNSLAEMNEDQRPERVLFLCITDGEENDSKEHTSESLKHIIEHQKDKYNWEFVFIGANQDSFASAKKIGIKKYSNFTPDSHGVKNLYNEASLKTVKYRASGNY